MAGIIRDWLDRNRGWIIVLVMLLAIAAMMFMLTEIMRIVLAHQITAEEWAQFRNSTDTLVFV